MQIKIVLLRVHNQNYELFITTCATDKFLYINVLYTSDIIYYWLFTDNNFIMINKFYNIMMLGHGDSKHKIDFNHPVYMECIANDRSGSLHFCLYNQIEGLAIYWTTFGIL